MNNKVTYDFHPGDVDQWLIELEDKFVQVDGKISNWAKRYALGHVEHYKSIFERVAQVSDSTDLTVLDIGAVPGHISAMLKHAGFTVKAVDIHPERAKGVFDAMDIPYYQSNVEVDSLPFPSESFDLVLFCEILEHLRTNPVHALREIYRVLKSGGKLLLSTPNITPLMRWRFLFGEDFQEDLIDEFAKLETIGHMGHFRLYSRTEVENLLTHAGFQILQISTGGALKAGDRRWDARLLRMIKPEQMRQQIYVLAER